MTATRTLYALVFASCLLALLMTTRPSLLTGLPDGPQSSVGPASPPTEQTVFLSHRIRAKAEVIRSLLRREITFAEAVEAFAQLNVTQEWMNEQGWRRMEDNQTEEGLRRQILLHAREYAGEVEGSASVIEALERDWAATTAVMPVPGEAAPEPGRP